MMVPAPKRPIDKIVWQASRAANTTATVDILFTAGEALTFSGGVLRGHIINSSAFGTFNWTIQFIPEGFSIIDITPVTNGITFFEPEQYILASGTYVNTGANAATDSIVIVEKIKTMRKMKKGDTLVLVTDSTANNVCNYSLFGSMFFKQ